MVVGVVRLTLHVPENNSLKGKRRVIKQIIDKTRNRFSLAIGETGMNDQHRDAELGIACVGNDRRTCNSVLDRAVDYIESLQTAIITGHEIEIINM